MPAPLAPTIAKYAKACRQASRRPCGRGQSAPACAAFRESSYAGRRQVAGAAGQFAGLVMYQPMNQVMFAGTHALPPADKLNRIADSAVDMFLATYG